MSEAALKQLYTCVDIRLRLERALRKAGHHCILPTCVYRRLLVQHAQLSTALQAAQSFHVN